MLERFRQVPLFADLPDDDLARICAEGEEVVLEPGQVLFREGEPGDRAFVVTAGQVEIVKDAHQREILLAVRGEDEVIGEMALLQQEPRSATVRARTRVELVSIPKSALDDLLHTSASAATAVFRAMLRRIRENNERFRHQERMVQLGTLTAGVAHELNNPAAAVHRAAEQLGGEVDRLLAALPVAPPVRDDVTSSRSDRDNFTSSQKQGGLLDLLGDQPAAPRTALAISDEEAAVEDWLADQGVHEPWSVAPTLVEAGIGVDQLRPLADQPNLDGLVRLIGAAAAVRRSAAEIATGAQRISQIVRGLKSYSYLDRAPVQDVDVVRGLEDTLVLLGHTLKHVKIVREYDPQLPAITAMGGELNQVWTNLIHNAADALTGVDDPTLTLRAYRDGSNVIVEVHDNGPGIPPDQQQRIFDAFYTTKPPGKGTGLGLHISHRVVVLEHRGDLTLHSEPGSTTFRVTLPIEGAPPTPASEGSTPMTQTLCEHLQVLENTANTPKPEGGCEECLAVGDTWVHLRFCVTCNKVGCCDDSKNRHATRHAVAEGHPVLRTKEPDENWAWCVVHRMGVEL